MKITIDEILPGDPAQHGALNSTIASVNAGTGDVDSSNYAEEGIDRRVVATGAIGPARGRGLGFSSTGSDTVNTVAYDVLTILGVEAIAGPYPLNTANGEMLRVRASLALQPGANPQVAEAQLAYSTDYDPGTGVGTWNGLQSTQRRFRWAPIRMSPTGANLLAEGWMQWAVGHYLKSVGPAFSGQVYLRIEINTYTYSVPVERATLYATLRAR